MVEALNHAGALNIVDCRVPVANTIGEVGAGFQQQMAQFQNERLIAAYNDYVEAHLQTAV